MGVGGGSDDPPFFFIGGGTNYIHFLYKVSVQKYTF